ncbi:DUF2397 family protein, partial [Saccharothrix algeriensis]
MADTSKEREAALKDAAEQAVRRQRLTALLETGGEVGLDHFAGLAADAVSVLMRTIEVALTRLDPVTGLGRAYADSANLQVLVRIGVPGRVVRVRFSDGVLTTPDVRVRVIPSADVGTGPDTERKG